MHNLVERIVILILVGMKYASPQFRICSYLNTCTRWKNEIKRWECVKDLIFQKDESNQTYVYHDCGGVGWGNNIRGLYNTIGIAMVLHRQVKILFDPYHRLFNLPNHGASNNESIDAFENRKHTDKSISYFDYEKHGRHPDRFQQWVVNYNNNISDSQYDREIVIAGICGGERDTILQNPCIKKVFPKFYKCAKNAIANDFFFDNLLSVPFFYMLFNEPNDFMTLKLYNIRNRLSLPNMETDVTTGLIKSISLSWGLRTPKKYIFTMHIRNIPLGFESRAIDFNTANNLDEKEKKMKGFWTKAIEFIEIARRLANCRGEELWMYFATDDTYNLRPTVTRKFSKYGKILFGLEDDEVGHCNPQWSLEPSIKNKENLKIKQKNKTEEARQLHGEMALVEWWIIANSNWLIHSGSSFAETASSWGLGPGGVMERVDAYHSPGMTMTTRRRDWMKDSCKVVYGIDLQHQANCPHP